ncbi:MAG: SDR family oxidoreductase [Dehalococcoidia bacterium]|tara:strand:+ start:752 stop:1507 length:756 start_codon:yes stop_codon:yes gene_type:complete
MTDFSGRNTLITGGSRGIGKAIALEFARRGSNIIFNYLKDHESAQKTEEELNDLGVKCLKIKAHLGDPDKIEDLFNEISKKFGTLDVLINNAASGVQRDAKDLTAKHWDWTMNINARAPWLCSIQASKLMKNGGSIVNISSEGSRHVLPYYTAVGASKAALESITRYLAIELADQNINVNAVSGGYVETGALDSFPNKEEMLNAGKNNPSNKILEVEDIAKVTAFLCTKDAEMIRGQVIVVDGGITLTTNM